jgi:hypothetical protein
LSDAEFGKNVANLSNQFAATPNRRFQLFKSRQFFIRTHNEALSVIAVRVSNEDRSPVEVHGCDAAPTPTGFAEIVRRLRADMRTKSSLADKLDCGRRHQQTVKQGSPHFF